MSRMNPFSSTIGPHLEYIMGRPVFPTYYFILGTLILGELNSLAYRGTSYACWFGAERKKA